MPVWLEGLVLGVIVTSAVVSMVMETRCPPPRLERRDRKRLARRLNRGRLPLEEPDRSLALRLAHSRTAMTGHVVMLTGCLVFLVSTQRSDGFLTGGPFYGFVAFFLLGISAAVFDVVTGHIVLRRDRRASRRPVFGDQATR